MPSLSTRPPRIKPSALHAFLDVVHIRLKTELPAAVVSGLWDECGSGGVYVKDDPKCEYRYEYQLRQPTRSAFQPFIGLDLQLVYCEVALDLIFADAVEHRRAHDLLCAHLVKDHHHTSHEVHYRGAGELRTRYTAPVGAPNNLVIYSDRRSKIGGEPLCVHVEWRFAGPAALRRAGIGTLEALLTLDSRSFWKPRLSLFNLNYERFGRLIFNRERRRWGSKRGGTDRRRPWIIRSRRGFIYNCDSRLGQIKVRQLLHELEQKREEWGRTTITVQDVVDKFVPILGSKLRQYCLQRLPVEPLLPAKGLLLL